MKTKPFILVKDNDGREWIAQYGDGTHVYLYSDTYDMRNKKDAGVYHIGQLTNQPYFKQLEEWLHMVAYVHSNDVRDTKVEESDTTKDKIFHVFSGLDAFIVHTDIGDIYPPYIAIIAKTKLEAREKAAIMVGQKLEDQDTNPDYDNFVSTHVEFVRFF